MYIDQLWELWALMGSTIVIGTRGSQLALWQANWVKSALETEHPGLSVELEVIKTKGDKILDVPLAKVGGKGLFVKEIEEALLDRRIDLAVHSMKDMPSEIPPGLCIGAVPERETPGDVLISRNGKTLAELPIGATIGTSSLRRAAQLMHQRPDLNIVTLRGNLTTRLKKLETEELDAIVLAAAGVKRLGFDDRVTELLNPEVMLPAVGQGALCIEIRREDPVIGPLVSAIDHGPTRTVVSGERAFLHRLEGGCQVPIAAHGTLDGDRYCLCGLVASVDGVTVYKECLEGTSHDSEQMGVRLADRLLARGARGILETLIQDSGTTS